MGSASAQKKTNGASKSTTRSKNTSKSNTTAKKSSTAKRKTSQKSSSRTKKEEQIRKDEVRDNVIVLAMIACTIILLLSNFNLAGVIGAKIKWLMFGLVGVVGYIFPIVIMGIVFVLLSNRDHIEVARIKSIAVLVLMLMVSSGLQRVTNRPVIKVSTPGDFFNYSAQSKLGGGFFGGIVCKLLSLLGMWGTMVVIILISVICLIIITEKSFIDGMKNVHKKGTRMIHAVKQDYDIYKEYSFSRLESEKEEMSEEEYLAIRRERTKQRLEKRQNKKKKPPRTERKYVGVTKDTKLKKQEQPVDKINVHEIKVDNNTINDKYSNDIYDAGSVPDTSYQEYSNQEYQHILQQLPDTNVDNEEEFIHSVSEKLEENADRLQKEVLYDTINDNVSKDNSIIDISDIYNDDMYRNDEYSDDIYSEPVHQNISKEMPVNKENVHQSSLSKEFENNSNADYTNTQDYDSKDEYQDDVYETIQPDYIDKQYNKNAYNSYEQNTKVKDNAPIAQSENISNTTQQNNKEVNSTQLEHTNDGGEKLEPLVVKEDNTPEKKPYIFPPIHLLNRGNSKNGADQMAEKKETAKILQQTLQNFGVKITITDISCGPSVTRYEFQPEMGVKVSKIVSLADDIKLNLAAADIRIEAPIPGKAAIGIEVPNKEPGSVLLRDIIETDVFKNNKSAVAFGVGKDIAGNTIVADIAKMPHVLIAGATGSGKSVCINTIIMSILYKADPEDVKLIMVDPKVVELSVYNGIPHLMIPVVTDCKKAAGALNWAVAEMELRYKKFAEVAVRDIKGYNAKIASMPVAEGEEPRKKMPQLVIIIDELADLMMVAPGDVETAICRLAQLARAAGIHLVIATQRPSVNVITGLIKANVPSRIAFAVSSGVDSRTIIDMNGAEKLLGKGDMLFYPSGYPKPIRVQGAFVSDEEVSRVVDFLKEQVQNDNVYNEDIQNEITSAEFTSVGLTENKKEEKDALFAEAGKFFIKNDKGSIGMLQRYYKIGYNRAARLIDQLTFAGVVGPEMGTKPRKVLMTEQEFEEYLKNNN